MADKNTAGPVTTATHQGEWPRHLDDTSSKVVVLQDLPGGGISSNGGRVTRR